MIVSVRSINVCIHVGLLLLDLSKAFDCLTHRLLLYQKYVDGIWSHASSLLFPYLSSGFIRVNISASPRAWVQMTKGVPKCSMSSRMLYNVFINDCIYVVIDVCPLCYYTDDKIFSLFHSDMDICRINLQKGCNIALDSFDWNQIQAKISKFQSTVYYQQLLTPSYMSGSLPVVFSFKYRAVSGP